MAVDFFFSFIYVFSFFLFFFIFTQSIPSFHYGHPLPFIHLSFSHPFACTPKLHHLFPIHTHAQASSILGSEFSLFIYGPLFFHLLPPIGARAAKPHNVLIKIVDCGEHELFTCLSRLGGVY